MEQAKAQGIPAEILEQCCRKEHVVEHEGRDTIRRTWCLDLPERRAIKVTYCDGYPADGSCDRGICQR